MKEKKGKTFAGKLIRSVLGTADQVITGGKLKSILDTISGTDELNAAEKEDAYEHVKAYLGDIQDARKNETARDTSAESSSLSKNIHEIIALIVIGVWVVTCFIEVKPQQVQIKEAVMLILGYLYGKSKPEA